MNLFLLFLSLSFFSYAQELPSLDSTLKLDDFLNKAKQHDPQLQSIVADRMKMKYLTDLNLPSRQLLLSVKNEYGFTRDEDPTTVLSATISKPLLESGTVISVGKTMTERPDRSEDVTQMRVEQALYRNAFGRQVREKIENLEKEKSVIELQVIEAYEDYLSRIIQSYLDLTLAYLNYQSSLRLKKETLTLLDNVTRKKRQNIASGTDLKRARLQTALRTENELQSRANLETLSGGVRRIIGETSDTSYIPDLSINMEERLNNINIDIEKFLRVSRSRTIYDQQENIRATDLKIVKENLKPSANLLLGFNIDNSQRFSTPINREEAVIGVNVDIPFDNSVVNAQIQEASYELLKAKLARKSFQDAIRESLIVIRNQILRQRELLKVSREKRDLSSEIVKEQTRRYLIGRVTLDRLIEDRNHEAQYEFAYQSELINLNKLIVQWLALTDQLVTRI